MKTLLITLVAALMLAGCGSTKNYLEATNKDKALADAIKSLNKKKGNDLALEAIPILYKDIKTERLAKIESYKNSSGLERWDNILSEYKTLQTAYDQIIKSSAAFRLITPQNFSAEILDAKQMAAQEYYLAAEQYHDKEDKVNAQRAYQFYSKADKYVPGYKDVQVKKEQAFKNATVNIIITPVEDVTYAFNSGWGNYGYNYSNEYFQRNLIRDLQSSNSNNRYPARFYTDWEARRENVNPDWVVSLRLRELFIPTPITNNYTQNRSERVQTGTDTAGRPIYQTVYATVNIYRRSFNARGTMEVQIQDIVTQRQVSYRTYSADYDWRDEYATYTGDSRALSASDRQLINNRNRNSNAPRKEEILNEIYRQIYPQVRSNIQYSVDW